MFMAWQVIALITVFIIFEAEPSLLHARRKIRNTFIDFGSIITSHN